MRLLLLLLPLLAEHAACVRAWAGGSALTAAGRYLLDAALASPVYKLVLVPQAKSTMVRTAEANGVAWREALAWIEERGPWALEEGAPPAEAHVHVPEYYKQPFHAYEEGNLCWQAAWEVEIASRAVGARNFPAYGAEGEEAFRGAFDAALRHAGATVPRDAIIIDLGCGSGINSATHPIFPICRTPFPPYVIN